MTITTKTINGKIVADESGFITESENFVLSQIDNTAEKIADSLDEKPIILIAGPSGSSKTTSAMKLSSAIKSTARMFATYQWISISKTLPNTKES